MYGYVAKVTDEMYKGETTTANDRNHNYRKGRRSDICDNWRYHILYCRKNDVKEVTIKK